MEIRRILQKDNDQVAAIIRKVMTEFGAVGEGYSILDPEIDTMFEHFQNPGHFFLVIDDGQKLQGCGGVAPLKGGEDSICELQKMYFLSELRGKGFGKKMLTDCIQTAKEIGYKQMYLETLQSMKQAVGLYTSFGFRQLSCAQGNTGHSSCDDFYLLDL
ncbi:MAG: GNAT family N-acetyltransferase [Saprospiraceae bacterium]|nr:GNAT family N-acetyltransferase [Saprospiraceae bacterium]